MKKLISTLRQHIEKEEVFFIFGGILLYTGAAQQFGEPIARIVIGLLLLSTAFYLVNNE